MEKEISDIDNSFIFWINVLLLLSSYSFETYMGLTQFSLSLVMAMLGCGYKHFVCLDTFTYFFHLSETW